MFGPNRLRAPWVLGGALCLLTACPDPGGKFDEFALRVKGEPTGDDVDGGTGDGGADGCPLPKNPLPEPEQFTGTYLFAVSTTLDRSMPFVYLLEVEAAWEDGVYKISMRDRPLDAKDRKTPVAEFGEPRAFEVSPAGCFESDRIHFDIPAKANPVIPLPAVSEISFLGNVANAVVQQEGDRPVSFWCGDVNGEGISPISTSLDGSTFAAIRVFDAENLPPVVIDCDMTPAAEL